MFSTSIDQASIAVIGDFIKKHAYDSETPLAERVDLDQYIKKIFLLGHSFEAWDGDKLIGLIVAYINDTQNQAAFITYVRIAPEYRGKGIASGLLTECLESIKWNFGFTSVSLEVARNNAPAISLYGKFGFSTFRESKSSFFMKKDL